MNISNFTADADIVGRRIRICWDFMPESGETLANIPVVTLLRKTHDFEFPDPTSAQAARYLIYASADFPPVTDAATTVSDLSRWERSEGATRIITEAISIARKLDNGAFVEMQRYTTQTSYDGDGLWQQQHVELLDYGSLPTLLQPGTIYYYQIFSPALPSANADARPYQATASATNAYGLNCVLYDALPAIYRRHDVTRRPEIQGTGALPEAAANSGQLRRFLDPFGLSLDYIRGKAEELLNLHDIANVDYRYLPLLAQWLGWNLSFDSCIALQRNEIKSAQRVYRGRGTVPTLRAIVSRYSGWYTQVSELAHNIVRTQQIPLFNIFSSTESASGWHGSDDAAVILSFGSGHDSAIGSPAHAATLTGSASEPFALHSGAQLSITVDGMPAQMVRFGPDDFQHIASASAVEVASALNNTLANLTVQAVNGRIQISSDSVGTTSTLRINAALSSLVTLENAPQGRPSPLVEQLANDQPQRLRLFYETVDPEHPQQRRIRYKTHFRGGWSNALALPGQAGAPGGSPATVASGPGQIWLAWIEQPYTPAAHIRTVQGAGQPVQPARLQGRLPGPFSSAVGVKLTLRGSWGGSESVTLVAGDFANAQRATTAEIAQAINQRIQNVQASALPNRALALESKDAGLDSWLEIDLAHSQATQAIGFDRSNNSASGSWSDVINWQAPTEVSAAGQGYLADLHAARAANGDIWLFWSQHEGGLWTIRSSRWNGTTWSPQEVRAKGGGANREPYALLVNNQIWLFWSRRGDEASLDRWTLFRSVFNPATSTWSNEAEVALPASPDPPKHIHDREPAACLQSDGSVRLFFRSNRAGGMDIWSTALGSNGVPGPLSNITGGQGTNNIAPAPVLYNKTLWLLYRSDMSVSLAQTAGEAALTQMATPQARMSANAWPSILLPDTGTLRHFAGTISHEPLHQARIAQHGQWADVLTYTPQQPLGGPLQDDDLYTRGTIGLYVSQGTSERAIISQNVNRLQQLVQEFLPINTRIVIRESAT